MIYKNKPRNRINLNIFSLIIIAVSLYCAGVITGYKKPPPLIAIIKAKNQFLDKKTIPEQSKDDFLKFQNDINESNFKAFSKKSDVVMIGDSLTAWGPWSEMFPDVRIANRGLAGNNTADIANRVKNILPMNPKKAFLMFGLNDIAQGIQLDSTYNNYKSIINILREKNIEIFIQSTIQCNIKICGELQSKKIEELNKKLELLAKNNGIQYIDINKEISDKNNGLLEKFSPDGYHLNGNGYILWRNQISSYVTNVQ